MDVPTAASVRDANRYVPPAITGLVDLLDQHVHDRPGARALVVTRDRVPLSYSALAALADDVAARLGSTGLRHGDAVGLICANTAEFVVALLGAARAGLVVAPIDPALPESQVSARIEGLGAQAILVGALAVGQPAVGAAPGAQVHVPTWTLRVDISRAGTARATLDTDAPAVRHVRGTAPELSEHDALVLFTGGSTDQAKMVPLTHANVAASIRGICATYELGPGDATVAVMPFFHGHGLFAGLLTSLASGGCVLLPERGRFSAHTFWDDVRSVGATWFTAVPTIHEILLERSALEYPGPQVAPLRLRAQLQCSPQHGHGAGAGAYARCAAALRLRDDRVHAPGDQRTVAAARAPEARSVGRATGVDLRVVDRSGHPCPAGTAHSFADGWFRTGDLGSLDEDGYLFLTGRIKSLINRGGEKISPEHVEDILAGCPGVAEAAVFAIPDATYGQRVGAAVVVEGESLGSEQILQYCRNRLSAFEVPDRLEVVAALPHTAKGGLDRQAVESQFAR